jgi:hypothetical protein
MHWFGNTILANRRRQFVDDGVSIVNKWRQKYVSCTTKGLGKVQVIQN